MPLSNKYNIKLIGDVVLKQFVPFCHRKICNNLSKCLKVEIYSESKIAQNIQIY